MISGNGGGSQREPRLIPRDTADLRRCVEPVPEGVARRAKGGTQRRRSEPQSFDSCRLLVYVGRKAILQPQMRPAMIIQIHRLFKCCPGLCLGAETMIQFVFLLENAINVSKQSHS